VQIVLETLSGKKPSQKGAAGVAQVVAMSSNPSTAKKKKKTIDVLTKGSETSFRIVWLELDGINKVNFYRKREG
jgi:hypothetical protein